MTRMRLHPNWRLLVIFVIVFAGPFLLGVAVFAIIPPPFTPLMILRTLGYQALPRRPAPQGWDYHWVPLADIAPDLPRAAIAAEDTNFCLHHGFDEKAFGQAWENYSEGIVARGGSTITQQTAKNVFLWPGRSVLRKAIETLITPLLEAVWGKRRIMEVYLNVVEWAPGVYGAEAAAEFHFHRHARELSPHEAALLAAVLPSPRHWSASNPGPYVESRAATIMAREGEITTRCLGK